ncbi:phage major capsid protein [Bradyrhizobium sp. AUGA SZCCT0160]|uniref:phage major capsid protein n=1 Tax=Bradyrhizobium sp. AUGA SZCCT0160 TaxID=2807662 RepID=UPI001BAD0807|nr:phage major capsid protein [Bradyrhizobium sp. AUGA SZCCT0160]MBR1193230.1 phage major capsid protein [Bradyrhizobium sp. AUGA SZCCT0160]
MTDKTAAELAGEVKAEFQKSFDAVKEIAEKALAEAAKGVTMSTEQKDKADDTIIKMNVLNEQLATLEQKVLEGTKGEQDKPKTMGEMFVGDDKVKQFLAQANPRGRIDLQTKATLTSLTTDAAGSVGDAIQNTRLPGILPLPQRRMTVRDLLSQGQMDGSTLEYVKETGFTNNAGMVAEGAAKPSSDIKLDLVSTSAKVIAHYMKASRQVLSDISQLRSIIDQRLLYGLAYKEESQLLNGDNTGQNLNGIIPQATAYSAPVSLADLNIIDVLRLAMLQAALAEYPASGHVMHPTDWAGIETLKDTTGRYIIGNPQGTTTPTLWALPVVATQSMTVRKFLTGAFKLGAQVFDRWTARVEIATENEDDFIKNLVTILAEERVALAVYRPEAFIYGDFDTALAA